MDGSARRPVHHFMPLRGRTVGDRTGLAYRTPVVFPQRGTIIKGTLEHSDNLLFRCQQSTCLDF